MTVDYLFSPELPFVRHLEAHYETIRDEGERLALGEYDEWPLSETYAGGWKMFGLASFDGEAQLGHTCARNALRCPESARLLARVPGLVQAAYSLLLPGAHVFAHSDALENRMRCHLGLRTNPEAGIRFGAAGEIVRWTDGRCLLFDPHTLHEAGNLGSAPRLVLLLDVRKDKLADELVPD